MRSTRTVIARTRKKPGPPATGKGTLIGVRLQPLLLAALDRHIAESGDQLTRPEAIRAILEKALNP
jgi:hypothetical protein